MRMGSLGFWIGIGMWEVPVGTAQNQSSALKGALFNIGV